MANLLAIVDAPEEDDFSVHVTDHVLGYAVTIEDGCGEILNIHGIYPDFGTALLWAVNIADGVGPACLIA